jgi:hypothetical protein
MYVYTKHPGGKWGNAAKEAERLDDLRLPTGRRRLVENKAVFRGWKEERPCPGHGEILRGGERRFEARQCRQ